MVGYVLPLFDKSTYKPTSANVRWKWSETNSLEISYHANLFVGIESHFPWERFSQYTASLPKPWERIFSPVHSITLVKKLTGIEMEIAYIWVFATIQVVRAELEEGKPKKN